MIYLHVTNAPLLKSDQNHIINEDILQVSNLKKLPRLVFFPCGPENWSLSIIIHYFDSIFIYL